MKRKRSLKTPNVIRGMSAHIKAARGKPLAAFFDARCFTQSSQIQKGALLKRNRDTGYFP